jgi:hypothetical protein
MPFIVFLLVDILIMWGVFALGYNAAQRWPVIGRILEEYYGAHPVGIVVIGLFAVLLAVLGIDIR